MLSVLTKSIHLIDYQNNNVTVREIPDSFNEYVYELINYITDNTSVRHYKTRSETTQVVSNVRLVANNTDIMSMSSSDIAQRLLLKESEAQSRIQRLRTSVKKGSLIQALVDKQDTNELIYLLAKVEHSDFVDDSDLSFKTGFSKDKKTIWKTCILSINSEDSYSIQDALIYSDTKAKYWSDDFLELDEMITDEVNTDKAFRAIDETLSRNVKNVAPNDYVYIRNSFIGYLKSNEHIDYMGMIDTLLGNYVPTELSDASLTSLKTKLNELPSKRDFDYQFTSIPTAIKAKIKRTYPVYSGIEIRVNDYIDNIKETIKACEETDGTKYLKIKTNNNTTYNFFK